MNFFASFKDKRLRYGALSTVMILFAVAIFVFVNLVADQFNVTTDLTGEQMYSISSYSKEYLAELDQDINIYALMPTGQEDFMLSQILEQYKANSSHINVEYRDPQLYPTFVEQFAEPDAPVQNNSVIVSSGSRYKVIPPGDMVTTDFDMQTFQEYVTAINFEPQISKAIHYVTQTDSPVIYHVTGSGEYELPADLVSHLNMENFIVNTVDLVLGEVPEDCDMLIITSPQRDWSTDEADRIKAYLENNGNAMFVLRYAPTRFTNMDNLLAAYGVRVGDYVVFEGDAAHTYRNSPIYLAPDFAGGEIVKSIADKGYKNVIVASTGIDQLELKKPSTSYEPLITTSADAYGKFNLESETVNKEPGDFDGPFNLGLAVTDSFYTNENFTTKMILFGSDSILDGSVNTNFSGGTNWDLVVTGLNWLAGTPESIYVPAKQPSQVSQLMMTQLDANILMLVSVILLPLLFVGIGGFVWFRRRHS